MFALINEVEDATVEFLETLSSLINCIIHTSPVQDL